MSGRFLTFNGIGSWELQRAGAGSSTYQLRIEMEDDDGNTIAHTLATFNEPPPLICEMAMSVLGLVDDHFTLDALFDGQQPTGIEIGDEVMLRLRLECTAGAAAANCDEAEFGIALFVDNFQFCAQPVGCPDVNGDSQVDVNDLVAVITNWGACRLPSATCRADVNHDDVVDVNDLVAVILSWGSCR